MQSVNRYARRGRLPALEPCEGRLCLTIPGFTPMEMDADVGRVSDVAVGDIDGDGTVDALAAFVDRNEIVWYANDGAGPKHKRTITADAIGVVSIAVGDLDGDGDLDVVSSSFGNGKVEWYENDGHGGFSNAELVAQIHDFGSDYREEIDYQFEQFWDEGHLADSLALADFNGDGHLDIGIASDWEEAVYLYENDGSGEFSFRHEIDNIGNNFVFADLDQDNDLDFVSVSGRGLGWHQNLDGKGTFGERITIRILHHGSYSIAVADVDGRNGLDILAVGDPSQLLLNSGDGAAWWGRSDYKIVRRGRPMVTDLDQDGELELVSHGIIVEGGGSSRAAVYRSQGPQAAADFDGDGDLDLLSSLADWGTGVGVTIALAWFRSAHSEFTNHLLPQSVGAVGDLDNDGDQDLIYDRGWLENKDLSFVDHPLEGEMYRTPLASDLDQDGDLDIAFLGEDAFWRENTDGRGNFGSQQKFGPGRTLAIGDIDGDQAPDVIQLVAEKIGWRRNVSGAANFGPLREITSELAPSSVFTLKIADLDADGDKDLLYGFSFDDRRKHELAWAENIDHGNSFGQPRTITSVASGSIGFGDVGDIDGDGDLDIVVPETASSDHNRMIAVYENSGQGEFGTKRSIATLDSPFFVTLGDIDGDGDKDIMSGTSSGFDSLTWHENLDGAEFAFHTVSHRVGFPRIPFADLDGDGDLDLLNGTSWFENRLTESDSASLPGDANRDGEVTFADFIAVSKNFGKAVDAVWEDGDFNSDSKVDFADFLLLSMYFGGNRPA